MSLLNSSGKLTLLRAHDVGTAFGPDADQIDVEIVIALSSQPGKAFGFQMRNDANQLARRSMLDVLVNAFKNDWTVNIDYNIETNKNNGVIIRVWVSK